MKWAVAAVAVCATFQASFVQSVHDKVLAIHGSGTTNPSKCYWLLMSQFMDGAKVPIRMTYRAVGSSTGQKEFLGVNNTGAFEYVSYNDFGSGDIPVPTADYEALKDAGKEMVHLPILLEAISIFHNIPGVPEGSKGLKLSPCVVARIFKRDITIWNHEDILALNPGLADKLPRLPYPIQVARRVQGSSSTKSITQYLRTSCPKEWPADKVGSKIGWPGATMQCEGSGGMTDCIRNNEGAIGYIDAGNGHEEGLTEIELENADGTFLSSKEAAKNGGIGDAAVAIPSSADANFGNVDLLNQPGKYTWPIVAMSYVYARKELSHLTEPAEQSLFVKFLESLYDEGTIGQCKQFGFTPVPQTVKNVGLNGIKMLNVNELAPTWEFEENTDPGDGQGEYVISSKRRSYSEYQISSTDGDVEEMLEKIALLNKQVIQLEETTVNEMQALEENKPREFTEDDEQQLQAALALGAISLVFWCLTFFYMFVKICCFSGAKSLPEDGAVVGSAQNGDHVENGLDGLSTEEGSEADKIS